MRTNNEEHEMVVDRLVSEALDDQPTGWMSDAYEGDLEYDERDQRILFLGEGSIDISHLASIVQSLMQAAREEERTSE